MSRAKLHLPTLPMCAGLLLSLTALACSDRRDDDNAQTRNTSEYGATAPADSAKASTTVEGGTVEPSTNTNATSTTTRRGARSSSTPAERYDPYAVDPAAPRSDAELAVAPRADAEVKAEVRAPVDAEASVTARASVTPPVTDSARASVSVTAPAPTDSARASVSVNAPARIDSARIAADPSRVEASVTTPTPTPRAEVSVVTTPATPATPAAPAADAPVKGAVLNDAHLFNIILLANAGDSARTAAVLGNSEKPKVVATVVSPITPVVRADMPAPAADAPKAAVTVTAPAPRGEVRVTSRGETSALFPLGEDCYWPTTNQHDDPKLKPDCDDRPVDGPVAYAPAPAVTATPAPKVDSARISPMPAANAAISVTPNASDVTAESVRDLAARMQRDHTELNARTATVLQRLNIAPTESPVSVEVYNRNQRTSEAPAAIGDRAWLENEVRLHEQSLRTVEDRLLPSANDAELRQVLEEQKRLIETHLTEMRRLLGTPGTASPAEPNHDMHMMTPDSMRMRPTQPAQPVQPVPPRDPNMMW